MRTSYIYVYILLYAGVLVLTWALLGAKYRRAHLGGAALCIAGLALLVMFDSRAHGPHQHDGFPAAVFGDALVRLFFGNHSFTCILCFFCFFPIPKL